MPKVPLAEQIEELEAEWDRRNRDYPLMVAKGDLRHTVAEIKQERLVAAVRTLTWLHAHQEYFKEYLLYATAMGMATTEAERASDLVAETEVTLEPAGDFDDMRC